jgi:hypothetical protein
VTKGKIIVSGALANKAGHGGEAWVRLNWVLGFQALGFRVLFLEQLAGGPDRAAVEYFRGVTERFGFADSAALIDGDGNTLCGVSLQRIREFTTEADALINISGHLTLGPVFERVRQRVYVDPGFTQFWHAQGNAGARLAGHDRFFTIGENIGAADCPIPTGDIHWRRTRPPIALDHWRRVAAPFNRFTTVANWRGPFGSIEFGGTRYGLKVHEFRKFIELPARARGPFELALSIHPADGRDREALDRNGWHIVAPSLAQEPEDFQRYVRQSGAEFSVAQGVYVQTKSGWFSDRTAAFLASGRPALVQDTGFSRHIPTGAGLIAFLTLDDAIAGAAEIRANHERHGAAARELAEAYFDSRIVITRLLAEL